MPTGKKLDRRRFNVVKSPAGLIFREKQRIDKSIYQTKISEALRDDSAIQILADNKYVLTQLRTKARFMGVRFVYAQQGEFLYIRPVVHSEDEQRLMLRLREPRTLNELRTQGFQVALEPTLQRFKEQKLAWVTKSRLDGVEKWQLTATGHELLKKEEQAKNAKN